MSVWDLGTSSISVSGRKKPSFLGLLKGRSVRRVLVSIFLPSKSRDFGAKKREESWGTGSTPFLGPEKFRRMVATNGHSGTIGGLETTSPRRIQKRQRHAQLNRDPLDIKGVCPRLYRIGDSLDRGMWPNYGFCTGSSFVAPRNRRPG